MSQPAIEETRDALEEFRKSGVPIEQKRRQFFSKRMSGYNAQVYMTWIERWAANAAANYPVVKGSQGVQFLRNAAIGAPAIVIGIGPSLDDNLTELKNAGRFAVLIATDAALRPLLKAGITPDIVVNYDARDEQRTMWASIGDLTKDIVLLANSCTSPLTIAAWKGPVMFFNMAQSDDEFATNILPSIFPFIDCLPNMGTVGNGAVFLASLMGCKPVITVGMDLCYREQAGAIPETVIPGEWRYRCQDWRQDKHGDWKPMENKTLYDNDERMENAKDEEIKGVVYKTDDALKFYRHSLVSNIGQLDIQLVNCSGGVLENLVKSMSLQKAMETFCPKALDPGRTVVKHLNRLIPAANRDWRLAEEARIFLPFDPSIARWE